MKLKKTHIVAVGIVVLVVAVSAVAVGIGILNQRPINETSQPEVTTPSNSTQFSNSSNPNTPSETPHQEPQSEQPVPMAPGTYYNIAYGGDAAQKFDVIIPQTTAKELPLIIVVHGGAWSAGDKSDFSPIAGYLAGRGYVIINTNYRLLPTYSYPAPLEDFQLLLRWVKENAAQYRIDVTRIGMTGHSAGGHLIALYALTQDMKYISDASALPHVYAIAPMAGGFTLQGINITNERREDTIMEWLRTANPQSLGLPIDQVDRGDNATFLLLHGSADVNAPPQQSVLFYQQLVDAGVPAKIKIYPGRTHLTLVSGIPSGDVVGQDLAAFFNDKLK